jgi:hypothetical protein
LFLYQTLVNKLALKHDECYFSTFVYPRDIVVVLIASIEDECPSPGGRGILFWLFRQKRYSRRREKAPQ